MPSEMRRAGSINIDAFIAALDLQMRQEVVSVKRRALPEPFHRLTQTIKSMFRPILQSAAVVLTSLAVIVAVGAAPASLRTPPPTNAPLGTPTKPVTADGTDVQIWDSLPLDDLLAVAEGSLPWQEADNPDMPPMAME